VKRADVLLGAMVAVPLGAVGLAYASQHVWGMQPCAWCVLQRVIFIAVAIAALLGLLWRSAFGRRVGAGLALLLAGSGIAAALYQHFVAASSQSCDLSMAERIVSALTLDERWPDLFMPMASCADSKVTLWSVPYEFWSLALFVLLALAALPVLRRPD
jgi:protein dithiol:quinone oxidoreductase